MAKPIPTRVPSDKCPVRVDGTLYYPHEGEHVDLFPVETIGELRLRLKFAQIGTQIDAIKGEPNEGWLFADLLDRHYADLCEYLSERVVAWDWTDLRGRPLPSPTDQDGKPLGLLRLRTTELDWLLNASSGEETEDERGNA